LRDFSEWLANNYSLFSEPIRDRYCTEATAAPRDGTPFVTAPLLPLFRGDPKRCLGSRESCAGRLLIRFERKLMQRPSLPGTIHKNSQYGIVIFQK
jgi:hypothetical protein